MLHISASEIVLIRRLAAEAKALLYVSSSFMAASMLARFTFLVFAVFLTAAGMSGLTRCLETRSHNYATTRVASTLQI